MTDTKKPLVRTFNDDEIKKLISKAPKELQEYIRATKDALDGQYRIALLAVKKLRDRTPEPVVVELVEHWTKQKGIAHIMPRPPEALGSTSSMKSDPDYRVGIE